MGQGRGYNDAMCEQIKENATAYQLDIPDPAPMPLKSVVYKRLRDEGRWKDIAPLRDDLMRRARASGLEKEEAQQWTYAELDRLFPPLPPPENQEQPGEQDSKTEEDNDRTEEGNVVDLTTPAVDPVEQEPEPIAGTREVVTDPPAPPDPAVSGLADIPPSWPPLPPNASLVAEIQWVQASRVDVVEELPSGAVRIHLDRADRPAPSKAALGWLETSVRAFSKYCDIAARATAQLEDEREHVKRERVAIEDMRRLLAEMMDEPQ